MTEKFYPSQKVPTGSGAHWVIGGRYFVMRKGASM